MAMALILGALAAAAPHLVTLVATIGAAAATVFVERKLEATLKPDGEQKKLIRGAVRKAVANAEKDVKTERVKQALPKSPAALKVRVDAAKSNIAKWHDRCVLPIAAKHVVDGKLILNNPKQPRLKSSDVAPPPMPEVPKRGGPSLASQVKWGQPVPNRTQVRSRAFDTYKGWKAAQRFVQHSKIPKLHLGSSGVSHEYAGFLVGSRRPQAAPTSQSWQIHQTGAYMQTYTAGGNSYLRVKHRELIGGIIGASPFTVTSDAIQPGLATSFPWLSTIATAFESYGFNSLSYLFCTSQSTATAGAVYAATDPDPLDEIPGSAGDFMDLDTACRGPAWDIDLVYHVPSSVLHRMEGPAPYLVRSGANAHDLSITDTGTLLIATQGSAAATGSLGELYAEYDITFATPHFTGDAQSSDIVGMFNVTGSNIKVSWSQVNAANTNKRYGPAVLGLSAVDPDLTVQDVILNYNSGVPKVTFNRGGYYLFKVRGVGTGVACTVTSVMINSRSGPSSVADVNAAGTAVDTVINDNIANAWVSFLPGDYVTIDMSGSTTLTSVNFTVIALTTAPQKRYGSFGGGPRGVQPRMRPPPEPAVEDIDDSVPRFPEDRATVSRDMWTYGFPGGDQMIDHMVETHSELNESDRNARDTSANHIYSLFNRNDKLRKKGITHARMTSNDLRDYNDSVLVEAASAPTPVVQRVADIERMSVASRASAGSKG